MLAKGHKKLYSLVTYMYMLITIAINIFNKTDPDSKTLESVNS